MLRSLGVVCCAAWARAAAVAQSQTTDWPNRAFSGTWSAETPAQAEFLPTRGGTAVVFFDWSPELSGSELTVGLQLLESEFVEERSITVIKAANVSSSAQSSLFLFGAFDVQLAEGIFSVERRLKCIGRLELSLHDAAGRPRPFSADAEGLSVRGSFQSRGCRLDLKLRLGAESRRVGSALLFGLVAAAVVLLGLLPFCRALRSNSLDGLTALGDSALLAHILVDLLLLMINMTFSLRLMIDYFEFFAVVSALLMVSVLLKVRFYLFFFDARVAGRGLDGAALRRAKSLFLCRFVGLCLGAMLLANLLIVHYWLWVVVFAYPALQLRHNALRVMRRRCFGVGLHPCLFLPQALYPALLRCFPGNFFRLHPALAFAATLPLLPCLCLALMAAQRRLGGRFFLPGAVCPAQFDYFAGEGGEDAACPICFGELAEPPQAEGSLDKALLAARAMRTPCGHLFHDCCLQTWMEQSLVCPCCRAGLPPF